MKKTSLCYLEKDDQYLMLHRNKKDNDPNFGKWIGFGGQCEQGESIIDCMKREVFEETGYQITQYHYHGVVLFHSNLYETEEMHVFTSKHFKGNLHQSREGSTHWIHKKELQQLNLWEGDHLFLNLIAEEKPFFNLFLYYNDDQLTSYELIDV